jgi:hypothetical protein
MKIWKSIAAAVLCGAFCGAAAQQQTPALQPSQTQQPSPTGQGTPQPSNPNAKVIFSRSDEDEVPAKTETAKPEATKASDTVKATDQERGSVTFTAYDLDVHLAPREHILTVRARIELRNDGEQPLKVIPLQISSSLQFEDVSLDGKRLVFGRQVLNSDVDHTGQLNEAVVELPSPLAPKATLKLETVYSGPIEIDAKRLIQLGTPDDVAERSDWDRISEDFTGLRGFGNSVWYPVSSSPALLGDGAKLFAEIGAQKLRQSEASATVRVSVEFFGVPPTVAVLNGHAVEIDKPTAMPTTDYPGIVTCSLPPTKLGFAVPSLFVASRTLSESNGVRLYAREENMANAQGVMAAVTIVKPLVEQWLGAKQKKPLTVVDLPEPEDAAYEQGGVLFTGITPDPPEKLAESMSHALAHAYFQSPREWLNEGVASFIGTLWIEHIHDRNLALETLEASRGALAFAEPGTPGAGPGQDLLHASDVVYYRTKAAYVFWMLRDIAGDKQLATALQAYNAAEDTSPEYFELLVERASGKDLKWFFDDWVYRDRGLPDLSIAEVHTSPAGHEGQYLVAINLSNDGFAEAEVPVRVRSHENTVTERVRLPGKTKTVHRMLSHGEPEVIIVNDGAVPEVQTGVHRREITNKN